MNLSLKYFCEKSDSKNNDKITTSSSSERRRLGKQKDSTEELLKKKIESLKNLENKKTEQAKEQFQEKNNLQDNQNMHNTIPDKNVNPKNNENSDVSETEKNLKEKEMKNFLSEQEKQTETADAESKIGNSVSFSSSAIDQSMLTKEQKDLRERIYMKIMGDLRRLDSSKKFNSKEINELYEIICKIKNVPIKEDRKYTREEFVNRPIVTSMIDSK